MVPDIRTPLSFVAYWWCSRTYMSWLVYLQKMCGTFCKVLKKDYNDSVTFGTKRWDRSLHLKNRPQKGPFTPFNYDEIWACWGTNWSNWSNIAESSHEFQISLDCFETTWWRHYTTHKDRVTDDYVHRSVEGILVFVPRDYDICNIVSNTSL